MAWARVVTSAYLGYTMFMTEANGFLPVGPYRYSKENVTQFIRGEDGYNCQTICQENGPETMYESYALMKPADGLVCNGHVRMNSAMPTVVRNADGTESASEQLYQVVGAGTSTIESVPCAIALVELAQTDPNRCAVLCANLGGDTDTIGAMATAICGALHGVNAIDPALKAELDAVNQLDFNRYATALAKYRQQREVV